MVAVKAKSGCWERHIFSTVATKHAVLIDCRCVSRSLSYGLLAIRREAQERGEVNRVSEKGEL